MGRIQLNQVQKKFGDVEVIPPLDLRSMKVNSSCSLAPLRKIYFAAFDCRSRRPTSGIISIDGKDATDLPRAWVGHGVNLCALSAYVCAQNIAFPCGWQNSTKQSRTPRQRPQSDYLDRKPGQLSGGQRRSDRACHCARTRSVSTDERCPIDAALRVGMRLEIMELHKKLSTTMVYVTHDHEAMTMADKIVVLQKKLSNRLAAP